MTDEQRAVDAWMRRYDMSPGCHPRARDELVALISSREAAARADERARCRDVAAGYAAQLCEYVSVNRALIAEHPEQYREMPGDFEPCERAIEVAEEIADRIATTGPLEEEIVRLRAALPFARAPHSFIRIVAGAVKQTLGEVRGGVGKKHAGVLTQRIASRALAAMRGERGDEAELSPIPPPTNAGVGAKRQGGASAQAAAPGQSPSRQGVRVDVALAATPSDRVVVSRDALDAARDVLTRCRTWFAWQFDPAGRAPAPKEYGANLVAGLDAALARLGESDGR